MGDLPGIAFKALAGLLQQFRGPSQLCPLRTGGTNPTPHKWEGHITHQMWPTTFNARNSPVRFGGRGEAFLRPYPLSGQEPVTKESTLTYNKLRHQRKMIGQMLHACSANSVSFDFDIRAGKKVVQCSYRNPISFDPFRKRHEIPHLFPRRAGKGRDALVPLVDCRNFGGFAMATFLFKIQARPLSGR